MQKYPQIFRVLLKLVRKNAQERLECQPANNLNFDDDNEQDDDDVDALEFGGDDEDFWQEQYDDNYSSALDEID